MYIKYGPKYITKHSQQNKLSNESGARDDKESKFSSSKEKEINSDRNTEATRFGQVFSASLGNINMEAEQSAMQQQIVDMYTRSMQQFTESLAKMKLPMDLDKPESEGQGDVVQSGLLDFTHWH